MKAATGCAWKPRANIANDAAVWLQIILDAHGREGFAAAWLRRCGLDWAAHLLPDLTDHEVSL